MFFCEWYMRTQGVTNIYFGEGVLAALSRTSITADTCAGRCKAISWYAGAEQDMGVTLVSNGVPLDVSGNMTLTITESKQSTAPVLSLTVPIVHGVAVLRPPHASTAGKHDTNYYWISYTLANGDRGIAQEGDWIWKAAPSL